MTSPLCGIDLDQYRTQAKDLLKQTAAAFPSALDRIHKHHPEHSTTLGSGQFKLADAQLVIARENGFPSWTKFKNYLLFRNAVEALDSGNICALETLLVNDPSLLKYECRIGEWYESGYFSGAGLLQHIAGNPIRCPLPPNIVDMTRLLLRRGADPNSKPTTISLLLTSKQASEAGVAMTLVDLLLEAGAADPIDLSKSELLDDPIWNVGIETARELVRRGARMDLPQAAALGRLDVLRQLLDTQRIDSDLLELSLLYACVQDQIEAVRLLLTLGAKGDVIPSSERRGGGQATALHNAAWRGFNEIVYLLLENGANGTVLDRQYGTTAAQWAEHGVHSDTAEIIKQFVQSD